jgi:hypothetical protein
LCIFGDPGRHSPTWTFGLFALSLWRVAASRIANIFDIDNKLIKII